jgi:hypothetical protein
MSGSGKRGHIDLAGAWAQMGPEQRDAMGKVAERRARLSPKAQEAAAPAARQEMIDQQADQAVEAALDALGRGRTAALLPRLAEMAAYFAPGQTAGSPYADLAGFLDAVAAVLRGESAPAVAGEYAERLAAVEKAVRLLAREAPQAVDDAKP